ncbi:uncharacterized protein LOC124650472 [Lolium rigidum]|uniref:uncharacterized protein LOC124650472 n=1 Tax=Lolium rigidum TaxID=89674 RepID=UPI001F5D3F88|nr:uncharacterized protein LOC124650472 [Lolium rigidum]
MSAMAATGAALRLHLLFRMLRVGELLALAALISWSSSRAPSAAAAAVRVAGSLLFSPRFVFVLGNAIVLLLLALSRRERDSSPVSSATNHNHPASGVDQVPAVPAAVADSFPSYAAPTMPTPEREAPVVVVAAAAPEVVPCREMTTVYEEEVKPAAASAAARVVLSKARAPRRSRSEKMSRRAASPEMRRSESDNGRRRRSSASARDVAAAWAPGTEDAAEFQRKVEAFIAKQTRFRREEECMAGALVVVE